MKKIVAFALYTAAARIFAATGGTEITIADFLSGRYDEQKVTLEADIVDFLYDETNLKYVFLVLQSGDDTIYAPMPNSGIPDDPVKRFVGARIRASGICDAFVPEKRKHMGRQFFIPKIEDIEIVRPAPADVFDVPQLETTMNMTPSEIVRLPYRRIKGSILASWDAKESLLETTDGRLMRISFTESPAPDAGSFVEIVGRPVSNVYCINLERAKWRPAGPQQKMNRPALKISAREILLNDDGRQQIKPQFLGKTVTMSGIVRNKTENGHDTVLQVENENFIVPVHVKSADGVETGCVIEATGICIFNIDNWRPTAAFPQIKGFFIAARADNDIEIVSRPSRWTTGRLLAIIGLITAAAGAVAIWNFSLQRLAERRGKALLKARLSLVKSELKIAERTRLAAELHDSLSQTLTGVAMGIEAAKKKLPSGISAEAFGHLNFASNAIDSSRDELRNCLWDLRGKSLDEPDMNKAIEYTLKPQTGNVNLSIRFNVPRSRLSDELTYATLRIIRELAANSLRHGNAKNLAIAGLIDGDMLKFSVKDDGCGFDPDAVPGIETGHFGLQGIRERVERFEGILETESSPGRGARTTVSLKIDKTARESPI